MRRLTLIFALGALLGCGSTLFIRRTVYVHDGDIVRLREDVKAKVWVQVDPDGDGPLPRKWEPSVVTLPEGWYCGYLEPRDGG